jgi:hypothetical protein
LSFRLSKEHLRRLRVLATIKNRTRSEVVREAIDLYFRSVTSSNGVAVVYSNPTDLLSDLLSQQAGNSEFNQYTVDSMESEVLSFQDEIDYSSQF